MPDSSNPTVRGFNEVEEEVFTKFTSLMHLQMERNSYKGMRDAWLDYPLEKCVTILQMSVQELRTALAYGHDVEEKAADVANWAWIIQDKFWHGPDMIGQPTNRRFTGE